MKAVDYVARLIQRETGKTKREASILARRIARTQLVRSIKEGPELVPSQ